MSENVYRNLGLVPEVAAVALTNTRTISSGGGGASQATGYEGPIVGIANDGFGQGAPLDLDVGHSFLAGNAATRSFFLPDGTTEGQRHTVSRFTPGVTGTSRIRTSAIATLKINGVAAAGNPADHFVAIQGNGGWVHFEWDGEAWNVTDSGGMGGIPGNVLLS